MGCSKFCYLCPKWCILTRSPDMPAVYTCIIHQHVYLLASALNLHYKEAIHHLLDKMVCSKDNRVCMWRCSTICSNNESFKNYLNDLLKDYDNYEEIQFSQWINDDRLKLQTMTLSVEKFIDLVTKKKIIALIPHSYISKIQSSYPKIKKKNLKNDKYLIFMGFTENYNFVLQNEVQLYHWSHLSC